MVLKITCKTGADFYRFGLQMRGLAMGNREPCKPPADNPGPTVPRIPVGELLGGGREAVLVHDRAEYRLRLTSNGKLILTK
jgi:hemin uptake protein HemP